MLRSPLTRDPRAAWIERLGSPCEAWAASPAVREYPEPARPGERVEVHRKPPAGSRGLPRSVMSLNARADRHATLPRERQFHSGKLLEGLSSTGSRCRDPRTAPRARSASTAPGRAQVPGGAARTDDVLALTAGRLWGMMRLRHADAPLGNRRQVAALSGAPPRGIEHVVRDAGAGQRARFQRVRASSPNRPRRRGRSTRGWRRLSDGPWGCFCAAARSARWNRACGTVDRAPLVHGASSARSRRWPASAGLPPASITCAHGPDGRDGRMLSLRAQRRGAAQRHQQEEKPRGSMHMHIYDSPMAALCPRG